MDTGTDLQIRLEEATKKQMIWKQFVLFLRECYDFIADVIFLKNSLLDKNILTVWMLVNY